MTLDQRLTRAAREIADGVSPPEVDLDAVRAQARHNTRRTTTLAGVASLAAVLAVIAVGVSVVGDRSDSAPDPVQPSPTPSPTETVPSPPPSEKPEPRTTLTAEQVVNAPNAQLLAVGVAPGDPDARISIWSAVCKQCPPRTGLGQYDPPRFTGMAVTDDGYTTATYVRPPLAEALAIRSPRDDVFLINGINESREWLVDLDGTVRRVDRVETETRPSDPRMWFWCPIVTGQRSTWCSIDVETATVHAFPAAVDSAVPPGPGVDWWGGRTDFDLDNNSGSPLEAWWDAEGVRHRRTLADRVLGGPVANSPAASLAWWAWQPGSDRVDLHIFRGGTTWEVETRAVAGFAFDDWTQMMRAPDGSWIVWTPFADDLATRLVVWRAEASGGPFRKVYEETGDFSGAMWAHDSGVFNGVDKAALSDDDGLTWQTVETWRPQTVRRP